MKPKILASLILAILALANPVDARQIIRMAIADLNYRDAFEAVAKEYMELHPDVDVRIQIISVGGYATWIRTALAGGMQTAPDIYNFNFGSGFYESGKAINLQPYLDSENPYTGKRWRDSFNPQYLRMLAEGSDYPQIPLNYIEIGIFYNQDIFDRLGLDVPETWEEFMDACQVIKDAGIIPVAMPGDKEGYWGGVVGWVVRLFTDAWFYDVVPEIMARPGDFIFEPDVDADFEVDFDDPFNDLLVNLSPERRIQAILDGRLAFDGPRMREVYTYLREFSNYWQRGFHGADPMGVYNLFLSQRAAMMFNASPAVLVLERDIGRLRPDEQFDWGAFHPPPVTSSDIVRTRFRGVGAPLPVFGIIRKSREQNDRAADFLMFLTSPEMGRLILDVSKEVEEPIIGPFAMVDVPLDEEMDAKFRPFLGHGREKLEIRGLEDEQESVWRWSTLAQDYMADRMTLDQFLESYQRLMVQAIPRVIKRFDLDMDPTTRDNNGTLLGELTDLLDQVASGAVVTPDRDALWGFLEEQLIAQARRIVRHESGPFDYTLQETVPIVVVESNARFEEAVNSAERIARENNRQFLVVVQLGGRSAPLRYKVMNYRPSFDEVIAGLSGDRYSREELRRIFR